MNTDDRDEFLVFGDDDQAAKAAHDLSLQPWKLMVVDDDESVHDMTHLALRDFQFEGRPVEIVSAFSGHQAKLLIQEHADVALMLLDVVMEDDLAGLSVVKHVREVLRNRRVRIVLRTGQPGSAPEQEVIACYDINDYKEKTELTARKLYTLMHSCLRAYRDICIIEENKRGLEQIIESSADLFQTESLEQLTIGVLRQLDTLLNLKGSFFAHSAAAQVAGNGGVALVRKRAGDIQVVAATGVFAGSEGRAAVAMLPEDASKRLVEALRTGEGQYWDDKFIGVFRSGNMLDRIVYLIGIRPINEFDLHLIELFSRNAGISFENLRLREEVEETQRELVYRLGGAVETRSKETGGHVRRVAEMSRLLAKLAGLSDRDATVLKHASPMHDVGKIGISDAILNKSGGLTEDEWQAMKRHTVIGYELFQGTEQEILRMGGRIALEHHEKWDGTGYPNQKKHEDIHIAARITTLVDVFDALLSKRVYKEAWPLQRVVDHIRAETGRHFDPHLVDLMLSNLESFTAIRSQHEDETLGSNGDAA
jgi:response regulator RpfG family c-di-GMP phosphodiesterase